MRTKVKDALAAVEEARNMEQQQRTEEGNVPVLQRRGERDGEKQFKMPTGAHTERISSEFTPLMAENWEGDMKLFKKNLFSKQRTLMKRFVSTALWPQVEVNSANSMEIMVRKVGEDYERQVPIFAKKVNFLELARVKGERYKEWANKINQQSELAHMERFKVQDLQLMKFCQDLHKSDRQYNKIIDMDMKSWASAEEINKKICRKPSPQS